jgi:WD40 repeat protein
MAVVDGYLITCCTSDHTVSVFDLATSKRLDSLVVPGADVDFVVSNGKLIFLYDGFQRVVHVISLFGKGKSHAVQLWEVSNSLKIKGTEQVRSFHVGKSEHRSLLAVLFENETIRLYDVKKEPELVHTVLNEKIRTNAICLASTLKSIFLVSATFDPNPSVLRCSFDTKWSFEREAQLKAGSEELVTISNSRGGIVCRNAKNQIHVFGSTNNDGWSLQKWKDQPNLKCEGSCKISVCGNFIAWSQKRKLSIYNHSQHTEELDLPFGIAEFEWTDQGEIMARVDGDGNIYRIKKTLKK